MAIKTEGEQPTLPAPETELAMERRIIEAALDATHGTNDSHTLRVAFQVVAVAIQVLRMERKRNG
jgi:hypothetical protein